MKNLSFLFLSLLLAAQSSIAATTSFSLPDASEDLINRSVVGAKKVQLGTLLVKRRVHVMRCQYDFSVSGGAVGTIGLLDIDKKPCQIPGKAIVKNVLIDVLTAPTSGGSATIAIGTGQTTSDLKAATAIASYTGIMAGVPVDTAATAIKITASTKVGVAPSMTIATAALTAGKFNVMIEYLVGE